MLNFFNSTNIQFQLYSLALGISYYLRSFKFGSNGKGHLVFFIINFLIEVIILPIIYPHNNSFAYSL